MLDDLASLYSAVVADVLDAHGYPNQCLGPSVRPLTPSQRVFGRVFTLRAEVVHEIPEHPYALEMEAIDSAARGDVLVVDAAHDQTCAFWGELLSTACLAKGVQGVVMTGCCRDLWALNRLEFPVFGIGMSPPTARAASMSSRSASPSSSTASRPGRAIICSEIAMGS